MNKEYKILPKISYNGLDKNWLENRTVPVRKSTFFDARDMEKSGRDLQKDFEESTGLKEVPRKFVNLGIKV